MCTKWVEEKKSRREDEKKQTNSFLLGHLRASQTYSQLCLTPQIERLQPVAALKPNPWNALSNQPLTVMLKIMVKIMDHHKINSGEDA